MTWALDTWTSNSNDTYAGVFYHFIDPSSFDLVAPPLCCCLLPGVKNVELIKDMLYNVIEEFAKMENITFIKLFIITDNEAVNNCLADILYPITWQGCIAHLLQLIAKRQESLRLRRSRKSRVENSSLKKFKDLMSIHKSSSQVKDKLQSIPVLNLLQDVVTRWWSTYSMLKLIL